MKFLELVEKRYSCRRYADRPVSRDSLTRCLEAARLAPSACNSQPWRFIVVEDRDLRYAIRQQALSGIYRMNSFAGTAPVLVAVVRESSTYVARLGGYFRGIRYSLIDLGIACEHLILQATEEGLGTCWIGWFKERAVKRLLGVPRRQAVDLLICVGYPEDLGTPPKGRKSLAEMTEYH